ncbi:hypothetical protein [Tessaracoccus coleopterorum]|uniref:hypothetical protein n=1 Tax=Tessaracoccus coleopterorum TaxID=2714950 RepID=UPI0018D448BB|nr:hypothetical protein [Tessaracoccus coleopterorum]
MAEAHERYRDTAEGQPSQVYPALAAADPGMFGVCVVGSTARSSRRGTRTIRSPS